MKKVFLSSLILIVLAAQAQKAPIFIKGDFGLSNIKSSGGKTTLNFGFGIGAETFIAFANNLSVNPALSLRKTGYETGGDKVNVNYITLDLPLMFNSDGTFGGKKAEDFGLIFGAGPFVGYAVSGDFTISDVKKSMSFGNGTADNRKSVDAGVVLKSALKLNRVFIGSQYNIGFTNLIPKDRITNGSSIRSRNFFIYVSVPLSGWKK